MPELSEENKEQIEALRQELRDFKKQQQLGQPEELEPFEDIPHDAQRKIDKLHAGLPVFEAVPTYTGGDGEFVWVNDGTNYMLYTYLDSGWRKVGSDEYTTDHGTLSGLGDDDHTDYHTDARGDARYIEKDGTTADISADIPLNDNKLTGVKDPTANQDAMTKKYYDDNVPVAVIPATYTAGDNFVVGDGAEDIHNGTSMTKVAEFRINAGGTLRIKFELKIETGGSGSEAHGVIYRNGGEVGTTQEDDSSSTYVTFSEDIAGWSAGDLVQLYSQTSNATYDVYTREFGAYVAESTYLPPIAAGEIEVVNAPTERNTKSTSYIKLKQLTVLEAGYYKVTFEIKRHTNYTASGKIYKNGVAEGGDQSTTSSTYVTKTGVGDNYFGVNDTIELWVKTSNATEEAYVKNLKAFIQSIRGVNVSID